MCPVRAQDKNWGEYVFDRHFPFDLTIRVLKKFVSASGTTFLYLYKRDLLHGMEQTKRDETEGKWHFSIRFVSFLLGITSSAGSFAYRQAGRPRHRLQKTSMTFADTDLTRL